MSLPDAYARGGTLSPGRVAADLRSAGPLHLHRRGHHVQSAHGRRREMAAGDHTSGCMIALMLSDADAKRLAVKGGEVAAELHCTLFYLGDDAAAWDPEQRAELVDSLRAVTMESAPGPVQANIFGIAHWNGGGDTPSWVWSVGDAQPENDMEPACGLELAHTLAVEALEWMHSQPALPAQHSPWCAHVCAAYTSDLSLAKELEKRLGPVTFDRIRVSFGDEDTDIPLTAPALTAAGEFRRALTEPELASRCDFAAHQRAWERARDDAVTGWTTIVREQRKEIEAQIRSAMASDDLTALAAMTVDEEAASDFLTPHLERMLQEGAREQRAEAQAQGVEVPEIDLGLTAASPLDWLRSVSRVTASVLSGSLVQSAKTRAMALFTSGSSPDVVAREVDQQLADLTTAQPAEQIGSAMSAAQNEGRRQVLEAAPPAEYYASELLDKNTCKPCRGVDGRKFATLEEAQKAYPAGGFTDCRGFTRCRGSTVAVWDGDFRVPVATASGAVTMSASDEPEEPAMTAAATEEDLGGKPSPGTKKDKRLKENPPKLAAEVLAVDDTAAGADIIPAGATTAAWEGPIALEGQVTGDGREFAPNALTWADLPVPLRWNKEDSHGGEARTIAVNVGRIDEIWRDGGLIMARGVLDLSDEDGAKVHAKIEGKFLRGVSIDADSITDADVEFVWPEEMGTGDEGDDLFEMLFATPEKMLFHAGRIRAATIVDIPAFAEAYIALLDSSGAVVAAGTPVGEEAVRAAHPGRRALTASVLAPAAPPSTWFTDPQLSVPTGITVDDAGRVYGHAALWGACHVGIQDVCVAPPEEDFHAYYMTGEVTCADGSLAAVGQITVGTGHAPLTHNATAATEHYDHTGWAVADVAVGNDAHGIWVAGTLRPGADADQVRALRSAGQVSGDWRRIGGQLRLVGLLAVNVPGFPVPRTQARVAGGGQIALVAAGRPPLVERRSEEVLDQEAYRRVLGILQRKIKKGGS